MKAQSQILDTADAAENPQQLIAEFTGTNADYYAREFEKIGDHTGFVRSFNPAASLMGSVWFGMRDLWSWFLPFVAVETFAIVQMARGIWGNLAAPFTERISAIERTLEVRRQQLAAARISDPDKVASFENAIRSLGGAIEGIKLEAKQAQGTALWLVLGGLVLLLTIKLIQGTVANHALEKRFNAWRSDRTLRSGFSPLRLGLSVGLALLTYITCSLKFGFPAALPFLDAFPTKPAYQEYMAASIKSWMGAAAKNTAFFFDAVRYGIKTVLDALELLFVETPWPVMGGFIVLLTGLSAGWRSSIFTAAALAYLGYLGFWEKSMRTLALLGTAACISICAGIPLGIACARNPRLYAVVRPILDFMQTMPAFVYLIPVIAFFGTGKPAAIVATMIFGGSPVVRLTVLGLRGVPKSVREAATAFGASPMYLLWKVDLPLAAPSILAGINQTILLSLAMVVIASLIGAKGLGEDVLEALQYASEGKGILAGIAILFCAMILDRIIQGGRR